MSVGSRIKLVRGAMSQEDFADALGVSKAAIGGYERDKQSPGSAVIVSICEKFGVEPRWLLMGDGPMRPSGCEISSSDPGLGAYTKSSPLAHLANASVVPRSTTEFVECLDCNLAMIPMVEARLSAGTGSFENGGVEERRYAFRSEFLSRKGQISQMVLMRVVGNSMEPEIHHDDVVLIDQSQRTPVPGALFAVGIMDMVYIKMVDALPGRIILKSSNPEYGPLEVDARGDLVDGIRIIGKAIWLGRELR